LRVKYKKAYVETQARYFDKTKAILSDSLDKGNKKPSLKREL